MSPSKLPEKHRGSEPRRFALLQRCLDSDDPDAWGDLFLFIEQTGARWVRCLLRHSGVSVSETEVVLVELFEQLYFDGGRRLRSCRAHDEVQFRAWLRKTRIHFTLDWLNRRKRVVKCEQLARSKLPAPNRWGPDEATIDARLEEWQSLMRPHYFRRLLVLMGRERRAPPISACTERRWIRQLLSQYPHLFAVERQREDPAARIVPGC